MIVTPRTRSAASCSTDGGQTLRTGCCAPGLPRSGRPPGGKHPDRHPRQEYWAEGGLARYAVGVAGPDFDGDIEDAPLWAGESCTVVNDIMPAEQIVRDLAAEAEAELGQTP